MIWLGQDLALPRKALAQVFTYADSSCPWSQGEGTREPCILLSISNKSWWVNPRAHAASLVGDLGQVFFFSWVLQSHCLDTGGLPLVLFLPSLLSCSLEQGREEPKEKQGAINWASPGSTPVPPCKSVPPAPRTPQLFTCSTWTRSCPSQPRLLVRAPTLSLSACATLNSSLRLSGP